MRVLTCVGAVLLLSVSTPIFAQEYENQDRVHQDPGNLVLPSDDVNDMGSRSDAVVIATFVGATGTTVDEEEDGWGATVLTTMRFTVQEVLKNDPRLTANGQLAVADMMGGGEYTKSKPHKVLKLSQTAEQLKTGNTYFLYLTWFEPLNAFVLTGGAAGVFDLTGDKVNALIDTLALAKKAPKMDKAAAIQVLRDSAVAARP